MNNQEQKNSQVRVHESLSPEIRQTIFESGTKDFLEGYGTTQQFLEYLQKEPINEYYSEYLERNSETDQIHDEEQAYSAERIALLDDYLHSRLGIENIMNKKNISDLRLGTKPIL